MTTRSRSAGRSRSAETSPTCGVYRLIQIFSTSSAPTRSEELVEIARPVHLLARDRAVDGDLVPGDVLQDPIVGGRRPPRVVLGLQAVDRDDDRQAAECRATRSGISRTALVTSCTWIPRVDSSGSSVFSSGSGPAARRRRSRVKRTVAIDERDDAVDELLALEVADLRAA